MALQIVRFEEDGHVKWGVHNDGKVAALDGNWPTTGSFLTEGGPDAARAAEPGELNLKDVTLLSPVTRDGDYICLGMNYVSHVLDVGRKVEDAQHNVFFTKASSCICGPMDEIVRPAHVKALDYEVELGLVITKAVTGPVQVTADNLHDYIGALVVTNDISARDVQIACEQFNKGKSYRTFGPTGPFLVLVTKDELARWGDLDLELSVDGERRQHMPASDMIHQPIATLQELSEVRDLKPGDMIATGTPVGTALSAPGKVAMAIAKQLSPAKRGELVANNAHKNPKYLQPGQTIVAKIATPDGQIDLGTQTNTIVEAL